MSSIKKQTLSEVRDYIGGIDFDAISEHEGAVEDLLEVLETLDEVSKSIARRMDAIKAQKKAVALEDIKKSMFLAGITADDIAAAFKGKPSRTLSYRGGAPKKYRDSVTGKEHSGRGKKAKWLQDALDSGFEIDVLNQFHPNYQEFKSELERSTNSE